MNERIKKIKNFLKENEKDLFLTHALALEFIKIGELPDALSCFEQNRQTDPNYVATYYHLGKLQELIGKNDDAITSYETGMKVAKEQKDQHSYKELQGAYEDLIDM